MELKPHKKKDWQASDLLLIVPYGIETLLTFNVFLRLQLLIVPYGIETCGNSDIVQ